MAGDPHPVFVDGVPVEKGNARSYLALRLGDADALRSKNLSTTWLVWVGSALYGRDASDTTSPDDGDAVILDGNSNRWKKVDFGGGDMHADMYDPTGVAGDAFNSTNAKFTQTGTGAVVRTVQNKLTEFVSVADFGAKGDGKIVTATCSITSGGNSLTATGASFVSGDVGKLILIPGAGAAGAPLASTITAVSSSTSISINDNAGTTLTTSSKQLTYGTDDKAAIQSAIDSLGSTGGYVLLPSRRHAISAGVKIGNGTSSAYSTKHGVRFIGASGAGGGVANALNTTAPVAELSYIGAATGFVVDVAGPLRGYEVSHLVLQGNMLANYGIILHSAADGALWDLAISGCLSISFYSATYTVTQVGGSPNTDMVVGGNITINMPDVANAIGMLFDGASDGSASSCFIDIVNPRIFPGSVNAVNAVIFKVADTVRLRNLLIFHSSAANATSHGVAFDYNGNSSFPNGCVLDTPDVGWNLPVAQQFVTSGSPSTGVCPNVICNLTESNGARYPTNLANVRLDLPSKIPSDVALTGQTAAISSTTIYTATSIGAGFYRLSYLAIMTTAGTAGTITPTVTWNDGAARTKALTALTANSLGNNTSGVLCMWLAASQAIAFSTAFGSVTGSPQYAIYFTLERLT